MSRSSLNLTRFQLNRQKFVFFTRGGSKLFAPNHLVNFGLNMSQYFRKNKQQTMRQLQFKFDPLPVESAGICLFHQRWIKTFDTQLFCQFCIIYGLEFYKIDQVQFCNKYMVGTSHKKNSFWTLEKWKIDFSSKENENSLRQQCWHSNMHPCSQYEII